MATELGADIATCATEQARHPCHSCPDREKHARRAEKALFLERENARAQERASSRTNTIADRFDRICLVLSSLGYLEDPTPTDRRRTVDGPVDTDPVAGQIVTDAGRMLGRIYAELDLVAAECIRAGLFAGLTAPQLAAVLASLVYESRRSDEGVRRPRMPDAQTEAALTGIRRIHREVSLVERDARLPRGPDPDIGFSSAAFAWCAGRPLADVLSDEQVDGVLTAGDFVRWVRQVLDFAGQIADAAGPGQLRDVAREVVVSMRRGVVAYAPEDELGDDLDVAT